MFKILITVDGLCTNADLDKSCQEGLETLCKTLDVSREDLIKQELGSSLKSMRQECEDWTPSSFRVGIFSKLLLVSGKVVGYYADLIVSIFLEVLSRDQVEPELRLKMFLTLSKLLLDVKNTLDSQQEFKALTLKIVTDIILPALKWQAGRKAEAVRIAAVSSLYSIFAANTLGRTCFLIETYLNMIESC